MNWSELGIATGIIGGAIAWTWKNIVAPRLKETKLKREELYQKVLAIHKEMGFNNGSTMKGEIIKLGETTKRIEFRLDGMEENQKTIMNVQGVAFWTSDEEGLVTYASPALCKLVERSEAELKGNNWVSCIAPQDKERIFDAWVFSVDTKSPFDEQYSYKKKDGTLIKVWGLAFHKMVNGKYTGTFGKIEKI